jgi:hypothetical protein
MRRSGFLRTVLLLTLAVALTATTAPAQQAKPPVVVALVAAMSGGSALSGEAIKRGLTVAIDEINAKGGMLGGRKIELVIRDEEGNPGKGVTAARDVIEREKDAIYSAAAGQAKDRVKLDFLIQRIAEKEDIKVAQEEILRRVQTLATLYQIPVEKFLKDLEKRNGLVQIYDQLAREKVMEFLEANAQIEAAPAA